MPASEYKAARFAGETAGRNRAPSGSNPYAADPSARDVALGDTSAKQQTLAALWVQGWRAGMSQKKTNTEENK